MGQELRETRARGQTERDVGFTQFLPHKYTPQCVCVLTTGHSRPLHAVQNYKGRQRDSKRERGRQTNAMNHNSLFRPSAGALLRCRRAGRRREHFLCVFTGILPFLRHSARYNRRAVGGTRGYLQRNNDLSLEGNVVSPCKQAVNRLHTGGHGDLEGVFCFR